MRTGMILTGQKMMMSWNGEFASMKMKLIARKRNHQVNIIKVLFVNMVLDRVFPWM
jgi:hypothetical protein